MTKVGHCADPYCGHLQMYHKGNHCSFLRCQCIGYFISLTAREVQVFAHIVLCESVKVIAYKLGVSRKTIEAHTNNLYIKTGMHSRAELLCAALRSHVIELDDLPMSYLRLRPLKELQALG